MNLIMPNKSKIICMIRTNLFVALILSVLVLLLSWSYYAVFSKEINNHKWIYEGKFTKIIIPDTYDYQRVIGDSKSIVDLILSERKNTIGPALIWLAADNKWGRVLFANSVFLFLGLMYFAKTAQLFNVPGQKIWAMMALLALLPTTVYYSVGALKEIPTLVFLSGFIYHYLKGERLKWLLFALMTVLFRFQLGSSLLLFLVADRFNKRSLIIAFIVLIFVSGIYPYIKWLPVFNLWSTLSMRPVGVETLGGLVENVRNTMPVISVFAVLIRDFQTIFEPLLGFIKRPTFYEWGYLSIYSIVNFASSVLFLRYWLLFIKRMVLILRDQSGLHRNVIRLYMLCLVTIVPIGGFSFIHHRYLYPVTSIVLLASVISLHRLTMPVQSSEQDVETNYSTE